MGVEASVMHRLLFAAPSAPQFVQRELERQSPDIVVIASSTHGVLLQLASIRVREVLGQRAGSAVAKLERFVSSRGGRPGTVRGDATTRLRRVARRTLRAKSELSAAELVRTYRLCFDVLARAENVHAIVLGGAGYSPAVENESPGWGGLQGEITGRLKLAALEHHFDWLVHEELLGGPEDKLAYFHPDGIHTDERSQQMVAEALLPLITRAP